MYSAADLHERFSVHPPHNQAADHFICVKYANGQWWYDDNLNNYAFEPLESDVLVASVDYSNDVLTALVGTQSVVNGIAAGYASGDLSFTVDQWAGVYNDGEFTVGGTTFTPHTLQRLYYYFGSQRIAMRENGALYWFVSDHLGSTSKIANADGSLKAEMRYSPWGRVVHTSGTMPTDFSYTGQRSEFWINYSRRFKHHPSWPHIEFSSNSKYSLWGNGWCDGIRWEVIFVWSRCISSQR